jgi:hypothetical protein
MTTESNNLAELPTLLKERLYRENAVIGSPSVPCCPGAVCEMRLFCVPEISQRPQSREPSAQIMSADGAILRKVFQLPCPQAPHLWSTQFSTPPFHPHGQAAAPPHSLGTCD